MVNFLHWTLPMPIAAHSGDQISLANLLTNEFGAPTPNGWTHYFVSYSTAAHHDPGGYSYWDPAHPQVASWTVNGVDTVDAQFNFAPNSNDFNTTILHAGNNIGPTTAYMVMPISPTDYVQYSITVVEPALMRTGAGLGAPTPQDIVDTINRFVAYYPPHLPNTVDCHFIAQDIAAATGATLTDNTQDIVNPAVNEEGGFWRIAYRGSDPNPVANWQTLVQPGDIVRLGWTAGGFHTTTVVSVNPDHSMVVYDNANFDIDGEFIGLHTVNYDQATIASSITIYRLTTDGLYLENGTGFDEMLPGTKFNDHVMGLGGSDQLWGNAGNDVLDGGAGLDVMTGGAGDDLYYVDNAGDQVIEAAGGGADRVLAHTTFALAAGQEVEKLTTDDNAGTTAINLTGNTLANTIFGNAGSNTLNDGGSGAADAMLGLGGNDFYFVNNAGDQVFESVGGGADRVFTHVSYALTAGQEIEKFTTDDNAGTAAINLTGNTLANTIFGNAGNNTLNDGGSGAADALLGLGGDDFYFVNNAGDSVSEAVGGGNDRVFAHVSYALTAGQEIEKLTTDDSSATAAINLTGNELANSIFGNEGNNTLNDGGSAAADVMVGFGGDDFYFVNNAGDQVIEAGGGGNDRVFAHVSYALGAGRDIEKLTTDDSSATAAINLTGNELGNAIFGNAGNNTINGGGGSDALFGFGGHDTFAFNTALGAGNVDQIGDFGPVADDMVALDHTVFAAAGPVGALAAAAFFAGAAAHDADDRIIYNVLTGALWYDADGNGAGAAVQFATLTNHAILTEANFLIV